MSRFVQLAAAWHINRAGKQADEATRLMIGPRARRQEKENRKAIAREALQDLAASLLDLLARPSTPGGFAAAPAV